MEKINQKSSGDVHSWSESDNLELVNRLPTDVKGIRISSAAHIERNNRKFTGVLD